MPVVTKFRPAVGRRVDDNIADRVMEAIWMHPFIDPAHIEVRAENGCVTLSGSVGSARQRDMLRDLLAELYCCDDAILDVSSVEVHVLPQAA